MTQGGQTQATAGIQREIALRHRVNLSDNRRGMQPIHYLELILLSHVRVGSCYSDHQVRGQAPLHGLSDADGVMPPGFGIAGSTEIVTYAVATNAQLQELGAVAVPLKNHRLRPIVPNGSSDRYILT